MRKTIRKTYPLEISIGLLLLVFAVSLFLSGQIFSVPGPDENEGKNIYVGMGLVSLAAVVMVLVLWEEILFPVHVKHVDGGDEFRNHRTKLVRQVLIYLAIPLIFGFVYFYYEVNHLRFIFWAAVCILAPVAGKLFSGINNYDDFLKLTNKVIEYKDNEKFGTFELKNIQQIVPIRDERNVLHKIQLLFVDNSEPLIIDLDDMELADFLPSIDKYMKDHYQNLLKG